MKVFLTRLALIVGAPIVTVLGGALALALLVLSIPLNIIGFMLSTRDGCLILAVTAAFIWVFVLNN